MASALNSKRGPYDIQLTYGGVSQDFMLARDPNDGSVMYKAGLIRELVEQYRVDPFSYDMRDPNVDIPAAFESFQMGAGFEDAPDEAATTGYASRLPPAGFAGYNYTSDVDASWGTRAYISPKTNTAGSVSGSTTIKKFIFSSSFGLFCINDRYAYVWGGASWTQVYDAGSGGLINDMISYQNRTDEYLLLGLRGGAYAFSVDGTNWTLSEAAAAVPSFRAAANDHANTTTITVTEPTGAASGDILICTLVTNNTSDYMIPAVISDWHRIAVQLVGTASGYIASYWHRRGASAPSLVFNTSSGGSVQIEAGTSAYSAAAAVGSPIEAFSSTATSAGTTHNLTTITTLGPNRKIIAHVGISSSAAITEGSGTERYDDTGGSAISVESFDQTQAAAGATGGLTATTAGSTNSGTILVALKPAALTGAQDVSRWAVRGSSSGLPVLWALDSRANIRSCTDPTDKTSWSTADALQVGQSSPTILGLEVINNVFYLVTNHGITTYDGTTIATLFVSPFGEPPALVSRPAIGPDGKLWFTYGYALLRYDDTNNQIDKIWPRGQQQSNSFVNGTITAITASEKHIYFALQTEQTISFVMKLDPNTSFSVGGDTIYPAHTFLQTTTAVPTVSIQWLSPSSLAFSSTNPQLVTGQRSGSTSTAHYFIMPRPGLRPEDDSNCSYATAGTLVGSYINYHAQGFQKWLTRGDIEGKTTTTETIALAYNLPSGSTNTITTANTSQDGRTSATLSPVSFTTVREVVTLHTGSSATTPVLHGTVMHAAPNAPRDRGFIFTVRIKDRLPTNHVGIVSRYQAANQDSFLFSAINQIVTLRDPLGNSYTTKVLNVQQTSLRYDEQGGIDETLEVSLAALTS